MGLDNRGPTLVSLSLQPSPRVINQVSAARNFILLFKIVLWVFFLSLVLFSAGCVEARCKLL